MTPFRSAIFALAALLLILVGCDIWKSDGYTWFKAGRAAGDVAWMQVEACKHDAGESRECIRAINAVCQAYDENGVRLPDWPRLGGCSSYALDGGLCVVYARYEVEAAKRLDVGGRTFFEHEAGRVKPDGQLDGDAGFGHCAGWRHKELHPRGM